MATMVNLAPIEVKPNVSSQNTGKKDGTTNDKSAVGFAKLLSNQADKNEKDDTNTKEDTSTAQSIMAMLGMALPLATNIMTSNQSNGKLANTLAADDTKSQPIDVNLMGKASTVIMTSNQSNGKLANSLITDDTKAQSIDANLMGKASTVSTGLDVTVGMNTSQNQLAALMAKMTDTNATVDSNKVGEFTQAQLQELMQGKQMVGQIQVTDISAKKVDSNVNNALLGAVTSTVVMDNSAGAGKSNNTQLDSKKAVSGTITTSNLVDIVGNVDVKPVTAPQSIVNVVDATTSDSKTSALLLGEKEQLSTESILSDQTAKNTDVFASMLNQQVVNENQVTVTDVKQASQQPVSDPYNIASQIVDQARLVEGQKNTEMIIQLKPEHLGELTLKVTVENGAVSASFHSNNSEVRNIIEASLPQLKQDMSAQGLKVENVGVYAGLGEFFSNGQHESQQRPEVKVHNKKVEGDFLEALESTNSVDSISDGSGVDYRI
jgi:flagellar hook-length control protein FliK